MNILKDYDSNQMFQTYGFGVRLNDTVTNAVSHCFALNGEIYNPECNQLQGLLNAYYNARVNVQLYYPTWISSVYRFVNDQIITKAAEISQFN